MADKKPPLSEKEVRGLGYAAFYGAVFGLFGALALGASRSGIATVGADYSGAYWLSGAVAGALAGVLAREAGKRWLR